MFVILRILSGLLDLLIGYGLPFFVGHSIFHTEYKQIDLFAQVCFVVYCLLFHLVFQGQTIGKKMARLKTLSKEGMDHSFLHQFLREGSKTLYFLPLIGIPLLVISVILLPFGQHRMLHDYIGQTTVSFTANKKTI